MGRAGRRLIVEACAELVAGIVRRTGQLADPGQPRRATACLAAPTAQPNRSAYGAAKHGLLGLTRASALEAGLHGRDRQLRLPRVRAHALVEGQLADLARLAGLPVEQIQERLMVGPSATGRLIEPVEVATVVRFPCSDAAAAITGSAQMIDGGYTAR